MAINTQKKYKPYKKFKTYFPTSAGKFLFRLTDSATPIVGTPSVAWDGSVIGGRLRVLAGDTNSIILNSALSMPSGASFIMACRYIFNDASVNYTILLVDSTLTKGITMDIYPGVASELVIADGTSYASTTITPAATLASEHTLILGYDAIKDTLSAWVNGVKQADGSGALSTISEVDRLSITNNATVAAFELRDIMVVSFPGASLPSDMTNLVSTYHSTPLTPLSNWVG